MARQAGRYFAADIFEGACRKTRSAKAGLGALTWMGNFFDRLLLRPESDNAQRGQGKLRGVRFAVAFVLGGEDPAHVADVAAGIHGCVAIDYFKPLARLRKADAIAKTRDRS